MNIQFSQILLLAALILFMVILSACGQIFSIAWFI
jgi:hypothetical protein